jgi:hypothetical protein
VRPRFERAPRTYETLLPPSAELSLAGDPEPMRPDAIDLVAFRLDVEHPVRPQGRVASGPDGDREVGMPLQVKARRTKDADLRLLRGRPGSANKEAMSSAQS